MLLSSMQGEIMVKFLKRLSIVLLIVVVSVITGFILSINMNKSSKTQMEYVRCRRSCSAV